MSSSGDICALSICHCGCVLQRGMLCVYVPGSGFVSFANIGPLVLLLQSLVKSTSPTIGYTSDTERDVEVPSAHEREFSFRDLTFPIIISIANYFILAFLSIAVESLLPLFYHMPIPMGGLDLDPIAIGYLMGMYGAGTGLLQFLFFARIVRRYGTRRVFILSLSMFIPIFAMFPAISVVAKAYGVDCWAVWMLVRLMLFLLFFVDTAYGLFLFDSKENTN